MENHGRRKLTQFNLTGAQSKPPTCAQYFIIMHTSSCTTVMLDPVYGPILLAEQPVPGKKREHLDLCAFRDEVDEWRTSLRELPKQDLSNLSCVCTFERISFCFRLSAFNRKGSKSHPLYYYYT